MEPRSGKRGGRKAQPTAATTIAGTPIQKTRDWLDPSLKKSAAKASPPAAAPQATGQRIAREANRAAGRILGNPAPRSNNTGTEPEPPYKALTTDSWHPHSRPARWARSSLESRASRSRPPHAPIPEAPHSRRCSRGHRCRGARHGAAGSGAIDEHLLGGADPRLVCRWPRRQDLSGALLPRGAERDPGGPGHLRDTSPGSDA